MIILRGPLGDRYVKAGVVYRLAPGERVIGSTDHIRLPADFATYSDVGIGAGDLLDAFLTFIGFKRWYSSKPGRA